jgi:hypothetical protein
MNQWNQLLPVVVRDGLQQDEVESLKQIGRSIADIRALLQGKGQLVSNKDVGKFFREIATHSTLKYVYTVSVLFCLELLLTCEHSNSNCNSHCADLFINITAFWLTEYIPG